MANFTFTPTILSPDDVRLVRAVQSMITDSSIRFISNLNMPSIGGQFPQARSDPRMDRSFQTISRIARGLLQNLQVSSNGLAIHSYLESEKGYQTAESFNDDGYVITHECEGLCQGCISVKLLDDPNSPAKFLCLLRTKNGEYFQIQPLVDREIFDKCGPLIAVMSEYFHKDILNDVDVVQALLAADRIEYILPTERNIPLVLKRANHLAENHSELWTLFLKDSYARFFEEVYNMTSKADISIDIVLACMELFPHPTFNKFVERFTQYNKVVDCQTKNDESTPKDLVKPNAIVLDYQCGPLALYRLSKLHRQQLIDCLGLPTDTCSISDDDLTRIMVRAVTNIDAYLEGVKMMNQKRLDSYIADAQFVFGRCEVSNTTDTSFYEINEYHPRDIARYATDGNVFQFTRPELNKLEEERKNFYTMVDIDDEIIETMREKVPCYCDDKVIIPIGEQLLSIVSGKDWDEAVREMIKDRSYSYHNYTKDSWKAYMLGKFRSTRGPSQFSLPAIVRPPMSAGLELMGSMSHYLRGYQGLAYHPLEPTGHPSRPTPISNCPSLDPRLTCSGRLINPQFSSTLGRYPPAQAILGGGPRHEFLALGSQNPCLEYGHNPCIDGELYMKCTDYQDGNLYVHKPSCQVEDEDEDEEYIESENEDDDDNYEDDEDEENREDDRGELVHRSGTMTLKRYTNQQYTDTSGMGSLMLNPEIRDHNKQLVHMDPMPVNLVAIGYIMGSISLSLRCAPGSLRFKPELPSELRLKDMQDGEYTFTYYTYGEIRPTSPLITMPSSTAIVPASQLPDTFGEYVATMNGSPNEYTGQIIINQNGTLAEVYVYFGHSLQLTFPLECSGMIIKAGCERISAGIEGHFIQVNRRKVDAVVVFKDQTVWDMEELSFYRDKTLLFDVRIEYHPSVNYARIAPVTIAGRITKDGDSGEATIVIANHNKIMWRYGMKFPLRETAFGLEHTIEEYVTRQLEHFHPNLQLEGGMKYYSDGYPCMRLSYSDWVFHDAMWGGDYHFKIDTVEKGRYNSMQRDIEEVWANDDMMRQTGIFLSGTVKFSSLSNTYNVTVCRDGIQEMQWLNVASQYSTLASLKIDIEHRISTKYKSKVTVTYVPRVDESISLILCNTSYSFSANVNIECLPVARTPPQQQSLQSSSTNSAPVFTPIYLHKYQKQIPSAKHLNATLRVSRSAFSHGTTLSISCGQLPLETIDLDITSTIGDVSRLLVQTLKNDTHIVNVFYPPGVRETDKLEAHLGKTIGLITTLCEHCCRGVFEPEFNQMHGHVFIPNNRTDSVYGIVWENNGIPTRFGFENSEIKFVRVFDAIESLIIREVTLSPNEKIIILCGDDSISSCHSLFMHAGETVNFKVCVVDTQQEQCPPLSSQSSPSRSFWSDVTSAPSHNSFQVAPSNSSVPSVEDILTPISPSYTTNSSLLSPPISPPITAESVFLCKPSDPTDSVLADGNHTWNGYYRRYVNVGGLRFVMRIPSINDRSTPVTINVYDKMELLEKYNMRLENLKVVDISVTICNRFEDDDIRVAVNYAAIIARKILVSECVGASEKLIGATITLEKKSENTLVMPRVEELDSDGNYTNHGIMKIYQYGGCIEVKVSTFHNRYFRINATLTMDISEAIRDLQKRLIVLIGCSQVKLELPINCDDQILLHLDATLTFYYTPFPDRILQTMEIRREGLVKCRFILSKLFASVVVQETEFNEVGISPQFKVSKLKTLIGIRLICSIQSIKFAPHIKENSIIENYIDDDSTNEPDTIFKFTYQTCFRERTRADGYSSSSDEEESDLDE